MRCSSDSGLGDTVYHTLLGTSETRRGGTDGALDRTFVADYEGQLCISPRYERLIRAVLGTDVLDGVSFTFPDETRPEEAAIADAGLGVYLTMTGSTARDHGQEVGERLFPSEAVLFENEAETRGPERRLKEHLSGLDFETVLST